jgi:hypothetical protein
MIFIIQVWKITIKNNNLWIKKVHSKDMITVKLGIPVKIIIKVLINKKILINMEMYIYKCKNKWMKIWILNKYTIQIFHTLKNKNKW